MYVTNYLHTFLSTNLHFVRSAPVVNNEKSRKLHRQQYLHKAFFYNKMAEFYLFRFTLDKNGRKQTLVHCLIVYTYIGLFICKAISAPAISEITCIRTYIDKLIWNLSVSLVKWEAWWIAVKTDDYRTLAESVISLFILAKSNQCQLMFSLKSR
jgi:hypothetical protein